MFARTICSPFRRCITSQTKRYNSQDLSAAQMNWSAEAITSASSDTEPSIVVSFDEAKYVFNAGENLSRAWLQSPRSWKKTKAIFLTSAGSQRASGLPGLLMFYADGGNNKISITGPLGTLHYLASMRTSLGRVSMELKLSEEPSSVAQDVTPTPAYADERVTVYSMPIYAESAILEREPGASTAEASSSVLAKRTRTPSPDAPAKRPTSVLSTPAKGTQNQPDEATEPIDDSLSSTFEPDFVYDSDPELWRKLMLENMFPFKAPEETPVGMKVARKQQRRDQRVRKSYGMVGMPLPAALQPLKPVPLSPRYQAVRNQRPRRLPRFTYGPEGKPTLCYILIGPAGRGRFDAAKAEALRVPLGPQRARLTKGETVTFSVDDGAGNMVERTVKPEDVVGAPEIPRAMVLLDVPSPAHIPDLIESFTRHPFYSRFHSISTNVEGPQALVHVVFHLCGKGVLEDERYKAFIRGFPEDTYHVISSREHGDDRIVFTQFTLNQLRLSKLDPNVFPLMNCRHHPRRELLSVPGLPARVHHLHKHCFVELRPPMEPCNDPLSKGLEQFDFDPERRREVRFPAHVHHAFVKAQRKVEEMGRFKRESRPGDDVEIVPLGTSSSTPTPYRNVSSTLVRIPGHGSILLDAGEGTWGQLARLYGDDGQSTISGVWDVLRDIRCIFVSHMHGDHHLGLWKILAMRKLLDPAPTEPLYVVGLRPHLMCLQELSDLEDLGLDQADGRGVVFIPMDRLAWKPRPGNSTHDSRWDATVSSTPKDVADMQRALGLKSFTAVYVPHRCACYGAVIDHHDGWSIAYSADCMPSSNLIQAGRYATLLIHEATLGDDEEEMARQKAHSTFSQAVRVGHDMEAENILLTHFSARYPKVPPTTFMSSSPRASPAPSPNLGLAFDMTRFTIGDMWKLRFYLPAIKPNMEDVAKEDDEDMHISSWD